MPAGSPRGSEAKRSDATRSHGGQAYDTTRQRHLMSFALTWCHRPAAGSGRRVVAHTPPGRSTVVWSKCNRPHRDCHAPPLTADVERALGPRGVHARLSRMGAANEAGHGQQAHEGKEHCGGAHRPTVSVFRHTVRIECGARLRRHSQLQESTPEKQVQLKTTATAPGEVTPSRYSEWEVGRQLPAAIAARSPQAPDESRTRVGRRSTALHP